MNYSAWKRTWNIYGIFLFLFLAFVSKQIDAADLEFSTLPDKSDKQALDGATIESDFYVFLTEPLTVILALHWNLSPDDTDAYQVFTHAKPSTGFDGVKQIDEVRHEPANFKTIEGNQVVFREYNEATLQWYPNDDICFRLKRTVMHAGVKHQSGFSQGICTQKAEMVEARFYLDDPTMAGAPFHVEKAPPWDLLGDTDGIPNALKQIDLEPGDHNITVMVDFTDSLDFKNNITKKYSGDFTVVKKQIAPPTGLNIEKAIY